MKWKKCSSTTKRHVHAMLMCSTEMEVALQCQFQRLHDILAKIWKLFSWLFFKSLSLN
jgi:hypothetical protein